MFGNEFRSPPVQNKNEFPSLNTCRLCFYFYFSEYVLIKNIKIQFNQSEKVQHYKFFSWDGESAVEIICSCVDSLLIRGTSGIMAVDFDIVLDKQLLVVSLQGNYVTTFFFSLMFSYLVTEHLEKVKLVSWIGSYHRNKRFHKWIALNSILYSYS